MPDNDNSLSLANFHKHGRHNICIYMCNNIDFDKMDIQGDLKDQMNMHYFAVVNIVICGCEFESRPGDTSLWDKVCQRLAAGRWFYLGIPISSTNQSHCHEITDILLKVALNTITLNILSLCHNRVFRFLLICFFFYL